MENGLNANIVTLIITVNKVEDAQLRRDIFSIISDIEDDIKDIDDDLNSAIEYAKDAKDHIHRKDE